MHALLLAALLAPAHADRLLNMPTAFPAPRVDTPARPLEPDAMVFALPELEPRMELLVLTTDQLAADSALLQRFLAFREAEGWEVSLATETDWDQPAGTAADSRQDRIRAYLRGRYADDPGAYLLLIGDPDPEVGDLPMLPAYPVEDLLRYYDEGIHDNMSPIPTDFYYAELSGEWDSDGDGLPWDYPDDAEGMDAEPELIVGRLPVYGGDADALDALLAGILARDLEQDKRYRRQLLYPAAFLGIGGTSTAFGGIYEEHSDGAGVQATMYRDLDPAFEGTRLFEGAGLLPSPYERDEDLSRDRLVELWSEGAGIVQWIGHGWLDSVHRVVWDADHDGDDEGDDDEVSSPAFLESGDAQDLAGAPGAFTWHVSCDNAWPEYRDNLALALLEAGFAGSVAATRVSYGSSPEFGETWEPRPELAGGTTASYYYGQLLTQGATVGEALAWTKWGLPGDGWHEVYDWVDCTGFAWATRALFNLYGDPTRSLELCDTDEDCDDGNACTGTESCQEGFCVHAEAPDCSELDSDCSVGICDPEQEACVAVARLEGASCDDGAWCTEGDVCREGVCGGESRDCGVREGWEAVCDEDADICDWYLADTGEPESERPGGCGCASGAGAAGAALLGLLPLGLAIGRRRW